MRWVRTGAFAAATVAIGLLVGALIGEASLRTYARLDSRFGGSIRELDPLAIQIEPIGQLGYRQRPNSVFHYANGTTASSNADGYRGPDVSETPAPGTVRIVLLGGSTTHGFGVFDGETIDAYMREILPRRHQNVRFEVVNLAFDGYDSYQLLERLRTQGLALHPTVVVMNEGINDVRNAWLPNLREVDPRTLIWEDVLVRLRDERQRGGHSTWTLVKHYSMLARIPGYVRDKLRQRRESQFHAAELATPNAASATPGDANGPPFPAAADRFERNVRAIVALATSHGARVVLSTPPSALRSYAPGVTSNRTYWIRDAKTTQDYRDELARRLQRIASGQERLVRYVAPRVALSSFLDDCHLTREGNRAVAEAFADAIDILLGFTGDSTNTNPTRDRALPRAAMSGVAFNRRDSAESRSLHLTNGQR
ncbi:MAG TPA: SGNH/GDSL hydrolase family protein [Gemmatimonadaceae bacterium]|nr:SGNH/GDSL hydrolase family protein [Gemmatimonadaceae bacterium]